ncbi:hypothetical protein F5X68DRAFT_194063 [Plectosphaerella plurivora]|uniref:Uncharacterized protein n=1 Tax=Plectosphaerella plurivora TaxID=936078 RepID=A0A9P8V460_9PEZI|nr:hypothetical protein F5X68DRAFT_194063 [Plectosphaerella plurivora]
MDQSPRPDTLIVPSPRPAAIRRSLSLWARKNNTGLPDTATGVLVPRRDDEGIQDQRSANVHRMITASNIPNAGQPRNAAELAVSLVGLVFPYDVRNMQRSLATLHTRMKDVEAKVGGDQAAAARVAQGLKSLENEIATMRALDSKTSGVSLPQDIETRVREMGEEMLERAKDNANSINDALQAVRAAISDLERERSQLLQQQAEQQKHAGDTVQRPGEDEISTASEDDEDLDPQPSRYGGKQRQTQDTLATASSGQVSRENASSQNYILSNQSSKQHISVAPIKAIKTTQATSRSPRVNVRTAASTRPLRISQNSPLQQNITPRQGKTQPKHLARNSIERRPTQYGVITKGKATNNPSRRQAFINYTKNMDVKFRTENPQSNQDHKLFLWQYIDDMEDKDMSAVVQTIMCESFPDTVSASMGRGKPYRKIIISSGLQWPMVLKAIKTMAVPDFLKEDA